MIKWSVIYSLILWNLVTDKLPPWLVLSREILQIWPVQIAQNDYLRLLQTFFKLVLLHQTGDCESGSMIKCARKTFLSLIQLRPCLKQLNRAHAWSYHHAVNFCRLDCSQCSAEKKLKILSSLLSWRLLFKFLHPQIGSNWVKLNFEVQPQETNIRKKTSSNDGVIKTTQKPVSKLGSGGMKCMQW